MRAVGSGSLPIIRQQVEAAIGAKKCHGCGCFHATVAALGGSTLARELGPTLERARASFRQQEYDCLGCAVCYPAIAANAFSDVSPDEAEGLELCPTDLPQARRGWPPLPGDYHVVRYRAPVAVCTLNSEALARTLADSAPSGLALVGTLRTENLGIERLIQNILGNPHIRILIVCGEDTRQVVGHLPGRSLACLIERGVDARGRIVGAPGKRPILKNVTLEQVAAFRQQVELVDSLGIEDEAALTDAIVSCAERAPGAYKSTLHRAELTTILASDPHRLHPDQAGFFVVYPDGSRQLLVLEHYTTDGLLDCIIEGRTATAVYSTAIERKLLSRLDHAAYLGRELARAEHSLRNGERYVQDRAPGDLAAPDLDTGEAEPVPIAGCPPGCCGESE